MQYLHKAVKRILWSYISLVISLVLYGIPYLRNHEEGSLLIYMAIIYFSIAAIFSTRDYFRAKRNGELW